MSSIAFGRYFQKVMWSKSDAFVRLEDDLNWEYGGTDEAVADNEGNSMLDFTTSARSDEKTLTNKPKQGGGSHKDSAGTGTGTTSGGSGGGGGGDNDHDHDVATKSTSVAVRAKSAPPGCTLQMTATLDFDESDPGAAAEAEAAARKNRHSKHQKKILKPGQIQYGIAKAKTCGTDEILQRTGGFDRHKDKFQGLKILDAKFSVQPLYENKGVLADMPEDHDDHNDHNDNDNHAGAGAGGSGGAPKPADPITEEEKAAARDVEAALQRMRSESASSTTSHASAAERLKDLGKRTGTK